MNRTTVLPEDPAEMTADEKILYIEKQSYFLNKANQLLTKWQKFDDTAIGASDSLGAIFRDAELCGLEELPRACLSLFNIALLSKINRIESELKSMIK